MEGFNYIFEDSTWGFDADAGACAFDASACVSDAGACIMNNTGVLESTENMKRTEILKEHSNSIWYSEKEGYWYCCLPDSTKKSGWKNVKRKKKSDIENLLCDHYINLEKQSQENADKRNMTLESLFYEFMEYKKNLVKAGTIKRMVADWERFYKPHPELIQKPFKELTKIDIDMFFNNIVNEHSLKDKAFHNMCGVLKQTLKYAVDAEYIDKNLYRVNVNKKKVIPTRKKDNQKEIFLPEEQKLLIEEMERRLSNNPVNTAPLAVMLDFEIGVRKGEMLGLRGSDIVDGKIHVCRQVVEKFDETDINNIKSLGFEIVDYTKSECGDRWIPLTERALYLISRIKRINKENNNTYKDFLFVRDGNIMTPDAIDTQLLRGCEYIDIPVRTMHKIRKTYASTLYKNGVPIPVIKVLLGHADEATTFKHYIFNLENDEATDEIVLNALQRNTISSEKPVENVRQREKNIIHFPTNKKVENPYKSRISH